MEHEQPAQPRARTVLLRQVREVGRQHPREPELVRRAAEEGGSRRQLRRSIEVSL